MSITICSLFYLTFPTHFPAYLPTKNYFVAFQLLIRVFLRPNKREGVDPLAVEVHEIQLRRSS